MAQVPINQPNINKTQHNSKVADSYSSEAPEEVGSSELKALIKFLEDVLGQKAPKGSDQQKVEWLKAKIKEKAPQDQIAIVKELDDKFGSESSLSQVGQVVKGIQKEVIAGLKATNSKNQIKDSDQVAGTSQFLQVEGNDLNSSSKPLDKSLGFMQNFAEHQQGFFEDSAFKFSEFAGTSSKSKEAYLLMREADKFWKGEQGYLKDLKSAGQSRENNPELKAAYSELFTLQLQMGSRFDTDFSNAGQKAQGTDERGQIKSEIGAVKSKIATLHTGLK